LFLTHAGVDAQQFVDDMRKQNKLIMGTGHRIKSLSNPDKRVEKSRSNMLFHTFPTISSVLLQSSKWLPEKGKSHLKCGWLHCNVFCRHDAKPWSLQQCGSRRVCQAWVPTQMVTLFLDDPWALLLSRSETTKARFVTASIGWYFVPLIRHGIDKKGEQESLIIKEI
jgi:hypothetical protein